MKKMAVFFFVFMLFSLKANAEEIKISFVGDIMIHDTQIYGAYNNGGYNFDNSFKEVKSYFELSDFVVGNLETTFGGEPYKAYPRFSSPDELATSLKKVGFNLLITANNHSMDTNLYGVYRTIDILKEHFIDNVGTYKTLEDSNKLYVKNIKNKKIGFINFTYGTNGLRVPENEKYAVNVIDESKILNDIRRMKKEADYVVLLPHMGYEYKTESNDYQKDLYRKAIDAGADIVIGSHPHVLQEFEVYKNKPIFYSLGNFISSQTDFPKNVSVILNLYLDDEKVNITYAPIYTFFRRENGRYNIKVVPVDKYLKEKDDIYIQKNVKKAKKFIDDKYKFKGLHLDNYNLEYTIY